MAPFLSPAFSESLQGARAELRSFSDVLEKETGKSLLAFGAAATLSISLAWSDSVQAQTDSPLYHQNPEQLHQCKTLDVTDGDTVKAYCSNHREAVYLRLYCIDAPETEQPLWGDASTRHLQGMLGPRFQIEQHSIDRYGRPIAELFDLQGRNLNALMVGQGAASVYTDFCDKTDNPFYYQAEDHARQKGYGIWQSDDPLVHKPWEFRRQQQKQASNQSPFGWPGPGF